MFYSFFRILGMILGYPIQLLFFKRKVFYEDKKNTKIRKGGKLIISNHYNLFDYGLNAFMVFPRKLTAVSSEIPFKYGIARFGMKFFGTIEATRDTCNMGFVEQAAEVIRKGGLVQIFPEARNTPDGKIHEFKPSYVVIAEMAECKILPIISDGNYGVFKRVSVMIGKEIDIGQIVTAKNGVLTKQDVNQINQVIFDKVLQLRETLEQLKTKKRN